MNVTARSSNLNLAQSSIIGAIVCFIAAVLLHFSYDWSNGSVWSILFAAANESIWEHIKILTLPYLLWSFIEISLFRVPLKNLIVAKTIGVYSIVFATIVFFKLYTSILGKSIVYIDILSAALWIALGFFLSNKVITSNMNFKFWFTPTIFALLLFIVMFLTFTIRPPKIDIFLDPISDSYGIQNKYLVTPTAALPLRVLLTVLQI